MGHKKSIFQKPNFLHFWASGPLGNCRGRDLALNGMIGIEIREILIFLEKFRFWFFLEIWKFWWEAPGLMLRASVECKDFSGLVGFDYYE